MKIELRGSRSEDFFGIELPEGTEISGDTCFEGGYEVPAVLTIDVGPLHAKIDQITVVTGVLCYFRDQLLRCYERLEGIAEYEPLEEDELRFSLRMKKCGKAILTGCVEKRGEEKMQVEFEMETDQSCFSSTIQMINALEREYANIQPEESTCCF